MHSQASLSVGSAEPSGSRGSHPPDDADWDEDEPFYSWDDVPLEHSESYDWNGDDLMSSTPHRQDTLDSNSTDTMPGLVEPKPHEHVPFWRCRRCDGVQWRAQFGGYMCFACGSREFYDANVPTMTSTSHGSWHYVPHGQEPPAARSPPPVTTRPPSSAGPQRKTKHDDPGPFDEAHEYVESETATTDPRLDPSLPRLSRKQRKNLRLDPQSETM